MNKQKFKWHSPHPGIMGCPTAIPNEPRTAAIKIVGTKSTPETVLKKIMATVGEGFTGSFSIDEKDGKCYVLLTQGSFEKKIFPVNCWRVIVGDPVAKKETPTRTKEKTSK